MQDTGAILAISQAPETVSFPAMSKLQQELVQVIRQDPAVENLTSFIGADGVNTTMNSGRIQITLKPLEERAGVSAVDVIRRLEPKVRQVAGIELFMQPVQDLTVEDRISRTQYQYSLDAPDKALLDEWVPQLVDKMKQMPELRDVASDQQNNGLGLQVNIDRDTAGRLGITPQNIDDALYDSFGQRQVSTIYTQTNQFHVILEVAPQYQQNASAFQDMYVPIGSASANLASTIALAGTNTALTGAAALPPAPLRSFVTATQIPSPITINHQSQFPVVTLSFNLAPGASLGAAVEHIKQVTKELGMPASIEPSFQGTAHAFESSLANESLLILAAIVTVYIVLGVLYESFIHPITILSTLPSAGVGAILALVVFHKDLDVIALIGIILLIGIVKKNAIMMIDFALEAERKEGKTAGGSHLSGVPAALPSHHDDHHGGAAGRCSAGLRQRRGFRIAPAARHLHHRRTAGQPGADALHHAGDLFVLRTDRGLGRFAQFGKRPTTGWRPGSHLRRLYEHLPTIYSEAGRHHAAADRLDAGRQHRLYALAGVGAAGSGLPHHRGVRQSARRQSRRDGRRGGDSTGETVHAHRRDHGNDFAQFGGVGAWSLCSSI